MPHGGVSLPSESSVLHPFLPPLTLRQPRILRLSPASSLPGRHTGRSLCHVHLGLLRALHGLTAHFSFCAEHHLTVRMDQVTLSLLRDALVASRFRYLWIKLLQTFACRFLCGHVSSSFRPMPRSGVPAWRGYARFCQKPPAVLQRGCTIRVPASRACEFP